jgi:hypothetical protein
MEPQAFLGKVSAAFAEVQKYRTPYVWVSLWAGADLWHYLAILTIGMWATARIWPVLNRQARWLFIALPLCGILSTPLSDLLLEHLRWALIPQIQPAQALLFTVAFASISCGIAGVRAARARRRWEACLWFAVVLALPMNVRLLEFLRWNQLNNLLQLGLALLLAYALAAVLVEASRTKWSYVAALLVPVAAMFAIPLTARVGPDGRVDQYAVLGLADWAEGNTWGSSMFLFPDAGHELYPGVFRAESRRALWVDWTSGAMVNYFESIAEEWSQRWQQTMEGAFSPQRLQRMLPLPIDYYVLKQVNQLSDIKPVFANREFVVYDSRDLKNASSLLRPARATVLKR